MTYQKITTQELKTIQFDEGFKLIDIQPIDAYNGWSFDGRSRGGHILNAVSLPYKWTEYMDYIEIVRSKGISSFKSLVLYGGTEEELEKTACLLEKIGYSSILLYCEFFSEWCTDTKFRLSQLKRYRHLVPPTWINGVINNENVQHPPLEKVVIVHAHYRNPEAYLSGHIPGAIEMDTLALESPETWNRRSPAELKANLEKHGIAADTTVVLYGKFMWPDNDDEFPGSAAGHIGAIRCAMIMLYAGVKDVRVLNGGFRAWTDAGYDVHTNIVEKRPVADFGLPIPQREWLFIDTPVAKKYIASKYAELVCVRSYPEFIGEVSGYNYIEAKGRIPGAVFADCGSDAYHMENYRNVDHTTRPYLEIVPNWIKRGITPEKHLAFYCGTGWRGSEACFNAWLIGWSKVAVYDGGWFEWSNDPKNEFETGEPECVI